MILVILAWIMIGIGAVFILAITTKCFTEWVYLLMGVGVILFFVSAFYLLIFYSTRPNIPHSKHPKPDTQAEQQ